MSHMPPPPPNPSPTTAVGPPSDPTPILSAIGDIRSPAWGDGYRREVLLEGGAVMAQLSWYALGIFAGLTPLVAGPPGIAVGLMLLTTWVVVLVCGARYSKARGVTRLATPNRASFRPFLFLLILVFFMVGSGIAAARISSTGLTDGDITLLGFTAMGSAVVFFVAFLFSTLGRKPTRPLDGGNPPYPR